MRALLLVLLLLGPPASAAVVRLRGGGTVTGTIVSATAKEVLVHTTAGEQRIETSEIVTIDYAAAAAPPPAAPSPAPSAAPPAGESQVWRNIEESRKQQLGITLGIGAPLSDVNLGVTGGGSGNNGDVGADLGLRYLYRAARPVDLGIDIDYFHRSATSSLNLLPAAESNVGGDTLLFMAVARWMPRRDRSVKPYLLGGVGGNYTTTSIDATPLPGFAWSDTVTDETRRIVSDSGWGLAATGRAGVEVDVSDPAVFSFEVGWVGLETTRAKATANGRALGIDEVSGPLHALVVLARYGWRF